MYDEHPIAQASLNGPENQTINDAQGSISSRRKGETRQPPPPKLKNLPTYSLSANPLALISGSLAFTNAASRSFASDS
jgi:hypothetical protein